MDDLISRQALLDAFGLSERTRKYGGDHSGYDTMMLYEIQDVIEDLPSAEPQERKGKWIDTGGNEEWYAREYRCSECGGIMLGEANFCPDCGAKMEVEHERHDI